MSLLDDLRAEEIAVELDGKEVVVCPPPPKRTAELRAAITERQGELRSLLIAERQAAKDWRVDAIRRSIGEPLSWPLPPNLSILNLPPQPGRCPCCGEGQPYGQTGRCTRCCLAAGVLLDEARRGLFRSGKPGRVGVRG